MTGDEFDEMTGKQERLLFDRVIYAMEGTTYGGALSDKALERLALDSIRALYPFFKSTGDWPKTTKLWGEE